MRPDNISEEDLRSWERSRQKFLEKNDEAMREPPPEVWYSGCWLWRELVVLGCDEDLAERIQFATGQRQAVSDDPWQTASFALSEYKQGRWEEPGPELAEKIFRERFGPNPDPLEVLASMLQSGMDAGRLLETAARIKMGEVPALDKYPKKKS